MVTTIIRKIVEIVGFLKGESTADRLHAESEARRQRAQDEAYEALRQRILAARAADSYRVVSMETGDEVPSSDVIRKWLAKDNT